MPGVLNVSRDVPAELREKTLHVATGGAALVEEALGAEDEAADGVLETDGAVEDAAGADVAALVDAIAGALLVAGHP